MEGYFNEIRPSRWPHNVIVGNNCHRSHHQEGVKLFLSSLQQTHSFGAKSSNIHHLR